ncbi:MAG: carbohydrate binding domain-containing protein, partial [Pyrinomonadaceae bacterium]
APHYFAVQWALGNALVRNGDLNVGFDEIKAAARSPVYSGPAVTLAWQLFDGDLQRVRSAIGDSDTINAALVGILAREKRFVEAFDVWDTLTPEVDTAAYEKSGEEFLTQLVEAKRFRDANAVASKTFAEKDVRPSIGKVLDGGFEGNIKMQKALLFEWQIGDASQTKIGLDDQQKHGGARSLAIIFNSPDGKQFRPVSQTVAVEPGRQYSLTVFYKSEIKDSKGVKWEISDMSGRVLAATKAATGITDWSLLSAEFTAPTETDAIILRLVPEKCGSTVCPLAGRIWFDDVSLGSE